MPSPVPAASKPNPLRAFLHMTDWRLVAAIGLPLWAFLLGVVVTRKPAPPAPPPAETAAMVPAPQLPSPQPAPPTLPEVIVRTELQPLPVVVPVPVPTATEPAVAFAPPAPAVEFKLPATEVMPADRCKSYDTKLRFHPDIATAAEEAKTSKKMLLVLHISGNFDDPGFT
jgi:hypothetical protein